MLLSRRVYKGCKVLFHRWQARPGGEANGVLSCRRKFPSARLEAGFYHFESQSDTKKRYLITSNHLMTKVEVSFVRGDSIFQKSE